MASKATSADDAAAALSGPDPISGTHNYVLPTAQQKALGLLENYSVPASGPGYVPALVPTLLDPFPFPGSDGTASDGAVTFSSAASFDYNRSDGISAGSYDFMGTVANMFSQIMGRTMEVGGTDSNFLNNVGVANNVPVVPRTPVVLPSTPASPTATRCWIYIITRRRELGISPKPLDISRSTAATRI